MRSESYERFAGACAIAAGVGGIAYGIAFVLSLKKESEAASYVSAILLLLGGLLAAAVFVALYARLRETDASFALLGLLLGVTGAAGSMVHGGYDLANLLNPPRSRGTGFPNAVDPRGLLTFGLTALAIALFSWLVLRGGAFPRGLGFLGIASAVLLVVVYVGRLVILDPESPGVLVAAVGEGFVIGPAWFVWLGLSLRKPPAGAPAPAM